MLVGWLVVTMLWDEASQNWFPVTIGVPMRLIINFLLRTSMITVSCVFLPISTRQTRKSLLPGHCWGLPKPCRTVPSQMVPRDHMADWGATINKDKNGAICF
jgi:hypothetical protein